jgi:hypothetical protein
MIEVISNRVLNRTLLARQHLLARSTMSTHEMIDHLVGLQAQDVLPPFIALWSRLDQFSPEAIDAGLEDRSLVRMTLMRGTIHLVTRMDALRLQPKFRELLEKAPLRPGFFFGATAGMNIEEIRSAAASVFSRGPLKTSEIREWARANWPDRDPGAIAQAAYYLLPILQTPPRGKWKQNNRPQWALTESWLGEPLDSEYPADELVLRYLRPFGPASTMDMQTWSRLTGFKEVVDRLGPRLRTYKDERGRTLYDLAEGELVDGDVEAPVRFLGWYDNVTLSHQDRSRIIAEEVPNTNWPPTSNVSTLTIDGFIAGSYKIVTAKDQATLRIMPGQPVSTSIQAELIEEGERLLRFVEPDRSHEIAFLEPERDS